MFSFTIDGRRLSDEWEPFKLSHDDLLERRKKFFDESWFKEMPISRTLDKEFGTHNSDSDGESSPSKDSWSSPISHGQRIQLGRNRSKLFDDPFFKDFMGKDLLKDRTTDTKPQREKEREEPKDLENFTVAFEIGDYEPEEIDVTLLEDTLKIHAKSTKPGESREMFKSYKLPEGINDDELTSSLSKDGVLHVVAPYKEKPKSVASNEDIKVEVPMLDFKPENISVSVDGNRLKVQAKKTDEKTGHSINEEVIRYFTLPNTANPENITSSINADGSIVIYVPMGAEGSLEPVGSVDTKTSDTE